MRRGDVPGVGRSVVVPTLERGLALDGVDGEFELTERVIGTILLAREERLIKSEGVE